MTSIPPSSHPPVFTAVMLADILPDAGHFGGGGAGGFGAAGQRIAFGLSGAHRDAFGELLDVGAAEHVLFTQQAQQALQDHEALVARAGPMQVHHRSPCLF
ncbi:hypothetical protein SAQ01S_14890 [Sphingomonas aquatilis NBRC 16722]|nr:hypothetical protein SAQ01S_14890 [Sphingomonas aquatilis NBRC 16722]